MRKLLLILFCFSGYTLLAQNDSTWNQKPKFNISGFADVFYVYDFNQPQGNERQSFLFNHNRHNEFNLNLGLAKFEVTHAKYRANFALQAGTYANDNYASEPGSLKNIFEANIGISLNRKNNIWIDAGVLPSHIGFNTAISSENWTFTRSLAAENSPYFLTGAKLTFKPNRKWEIAGLILNGWQRIQRLEGNSLPSFGTQVNFSPKENVTLNWSTFLGTDEPDSSRTMRYFNNFYGQFQVTNKFGLIVGFDIGSQQKFRNSSEYDFWYTPVLVGRYILSKNWKTALRAEYYHDPAGVIIPTNLDEGFRTGGLSLNVDYSPHPTIFCRIEGRWMQSTGNLFETNTAPSNQNFIIGTSLAISFSGSADQ